MADNQSSSILEWISSYWEMIVGFLVGALGILRGTFLAGQKKVLLDTMQTDINNLGSSLREVKSIIPNTAIKEGLMLTTQAACNEARDKCKNHIVAEQQADTLIIIKQAIALLVSHNNDIPQAARDKILGKLME